MLRRRAGRQPPAFFSRVLRCPAASSGARPAPINLPIISQSSLNHHSIITQSSVQVRLGRDRLGIKSSPSFYFFQNGKLARWGIYPRFYCLPHWVVSRLSLTAASASPPLSRRVQALPRQAVAAACLRCLIAIPHADQSLSPVPRRQAHQHSGAKEEKFEASMAKFFPDKFPSMP